MDKSRTTPYHPSGNGMCERFNRTLLDMLGTLEPKSKLDWKGMSGRWSMHTIAYDSTGRSPFYPMFGREPRLPLDLSYGLELKKVQPLSKYVTSMRERLAKLYELASSASHDANRRQKKVYD
jgi:transposase InsO family protein